MAIEIDADDVTNAEDFLEALLTEEIPSGRFTRGSALRDLVIKSMAFTFAHIQKENATVRSLQSLLTVKNISTADDPDLDRAVTSSTDAILSNWFITRKAGNFARGLVFVEVTKKQDYIIPGSHQFVYDRTRIFYQDIPDPTVSTVIKATDLLPVIATNGTVQAYQFSVRVIAAKTGSDYNVPAARWQQGTSFSPFATGVFNAVKFEGGTGRETVSEAIARAPNAVSVRNLINARSIDAVLRDKYNTIKRLVVLGMGDPEMRRDVKVELSSVISLHIGGHYDVYLELPRVEATYEGRLGDKTLRPDGLINIFRDTAITDWTLLPVQPGDVIRVNAGLDEAPKDFVIKEVISTELHISENTPFSVATDEDGTLIDYYIYRPLYTSDTQIYPTAGISSTGESSRQMQIPNTLILPGGPHYDIVDVLVTDPDPGDPFIDAADGYIHFPVRKNIAPVAVLDQEDLQYQIYNNTPSTAGSQLSMDYLRLESSYNGKNVRVKYDTLANLDVIHSFTRDRFERVLAGNILVKGYHQVYLTMTVPYRLKPNVTTAIDEESLRHTIADFINSFDPNDVIDVSDISYLTRDFNAGIGAVMPFDIYYTLIVPDGRTIRYKTSDEVRLLSDKIDDDDDNVTLTDPTQLSISDRTVRYVTSYERIFVEQRT
jgi:hypothetical protein